VPKPLQPMLATLIDAPFDNPEWVFQNKWDGFRLVASIKRGSVTLYSRSGLIAGDNYKPVAKALEKIKHDAVVDGELVALSTAPTSVPLYRSLRTTVRRSESCVCQTQKSR
jgi:bifunctional non-homologous end joining protein LigD